jgi:hypothetical protein
MAKFCAECGFQLSGSEKFCGACGKQVINLCPTCGQEWNQAPATQTPTAAKKVKAAAAETVSTGAGSFAQTSARVQPIYGPAFEAGKDCPNCGAKGMDNKTCKTCESEN